LEAGKSTGQHSEFSAEISEPAFGSALAIGEGDGDKGWKK